MRNVSGDFTASLLVLTCLIPTILSTEVLQCKSKNFDLENSVNVTNCDKPPCVLKRKNTYTVNLKFSPDHDIKNVRTSVQGIIAGIPLPFLGVDGTSACGKIYDKDGKTPVKCPLEKGVQYTYINKFDILQVYPKVRVVVHWALVDQATNKDITCFEVNARIVS
ncbi:Hypothetical protein domain [Nesidiocoris tenuis]|uniref:MD-2-related lipid-recognition domain-containing protein n=1 Tax=Nesidiocoris tenuis TaxID=355587 RepID=A0ABN7AI77_9HEMI|nr:Hypothetical protein domain [Nesidiocoris tenuis]